MRIRDYVGLGVGAVAMMATPVYAGDRSVVNSVKTAGKIVANIVVQPLYTEPKNVWDKTKDEGVGRGFLEILISPLRVGSKFLEEGSALLSGKDSGRRPEESSRNWAD